MKRRPIRVRRGEVPKCEVIVDPDTPKHRRIRITLYLVAWIPMILTILVGGEIGPPLFLLVMTIGIAHGCVRPTKSFRLVGGKRREPTAQHYAGPVQAERRKRHV